MAGHEEGLEMLNPIAMPRAQSKLKSSQKPEKMPTVNICFGTTDEFIKINVDGSPSEDFDACQSFLEEQRSKNLLNFTPSEWKGTIPGLQISNFMYLFVFSQVIFVLIASLVLLPEKYRNEHPGWKIPGWIAIMNWKDTLLCPDPDGDDEYTAILCSDGFLQVSMVAIARLSAYFMYPALFFVFITKAHALRTWLSHSCLSMYIPFYDWHTLHVYCGNCVSVCTAIHVICWLVNFTDRKPETVHLISGKIGVTGVVATIILPLLVCLMAFGIMQKKLTWEFRKVGIHVVGSWLFAIMLYYHCKNGSWVLIAFFIYIADLIFVSAFRTYKIEHSKFQIIGKNCVKLQFKNPATMDVSHLGYVNICVPWLHKNQWHAFSCYPSPTLENHTELCMQVTGDWTMELFNSLSARATVRPVWIQGPFASPYEKSVERDNLIMVASGIGITPAISCLSALGKSRRTNLIWICRDPSLIEFFLPVVAWPESGWALIFYTGKPTLELPADFILPENAKIIRGRPKLNHLIPVLINSIERKIALPEDLIAEKRRTMVITQSSIENIDLNQSPVNRLRLMINQLIGPHMSCEDFYEHFDTELDHSLKATELIRGLSFFSRRLFVLSVDEIATLMEVITKRQGAEMITEKEFKAFIAETVIIDGNVPNSKKDKVLPIGKRMSTKDKREHLMSTKDKREHLMKVFREFDIDGDGTISLDELIIAMRKCGKHITRMQAEVAMVNARNESVRDDLRATFDGISFDEFYLLFKDASRDSEGKIVDFFSDVMLPKNITERWAMLYCGGAAPVIEALEQCSKTLGVKFKSESFSW